MHIPDGLLSPTVSISGYAMTGGLTWFCLRQIHKIPNYQEQIPKASLLTAVFFVSSLIHIPIPPFSIHLILNGLMGIMLGYFSFLGILIGLCFQAVFFQHGGLSTLGINGIILGLPALISYFLWHCKKYSLFNFKIDKNIIFFLGGFLGVFLSALLFISINLANISPDLNIELERATFFTSLIGYGIQGIIEGILVVIVISFFEKIKPEIISN
ncbi:cobalt transporter CbiM [Cyanobacterium stanieri LEGE 03274]|uniref:Cobalt transporter CbiM n=1 Tax=Cyanobacterium stanieri LEGE 03274 TaxID=1828756 RepID=A0ABR9V2Y4_9CHRO|nr:cobalt transporter CbiM [Cyanobacterium stanieri]MBE9221911.1 cobalt transporter CbiM [Cyanobacterium stanieri LEGE 03274]